MNIINFPAQNNQVICFVLLPNPNSGVNIVGQLNTPSISLSGMRPPAATAIPTPNIVIIP
ncbi:hypothetical protein GCM10023116_45100 [Kistimonas scapharcae]|uniref:Uncharacterized protein n=1 Tax=Kistimonas scapharcae TaxID=1036133 RepID=A0ABP8V8J7_9GAMM